MSINTAKTVINTLSVLKDSSNTIPAAIIEGFCTSGRTYRSYKRGGELEAKERFREEATSGVFWLFGVNWFNKIGDVIGKKLFKLEKLGVDVGKDALRDPFANIDSSIKTKTAIFKFAKILSSVALATGLLGVAVPKVNHAITERTMKKRKEQTQGSKQTYSLDKYISSSKNNPQEPSFKGSEGLLNFVMTASHNLENNRTCRLISTDSGMILGRMVNSRHAAERFEYGFRDLCSIFFYNFSTGLTIFALSKLLRKTDIHPKAIEKVCEFLKDKNLSGDEILSTLNKYDENVFNKIKFQDNGTIKLKNLIDNLRELGVSSQALEQKAKETSELQPLLRGESVLSSAQVKDVLSQSISSDPKFLKDTINSVTDGRALNPEKFISAKECQKIRESLDGFIKEIATKAGSNKIDAEYLKNNKIMKKALNTSAAFQIAGMGVSIFGLAILIPKLQIYLSQKLYGKKSFEEIAQGDKKTKNDGKVPS